MICADRSESVARSIGMVFGGGLNGTVFRSPPSCHPCVKGGMRSETIIRYRSPKHAGPLQKRIHESPVPCSPSPDPDSI